MPNILPVITILQTSLTGRETIKIHKDSIIGMNIEEIMTIIKIKGESF